jgi:hypothetical protein
VESFMLCGAEAGSRLSGREAGCGSVRVQRRRRARWGTMRFPNA